MTTEAVPEFLAISVDFAKLNGFPSASLITRLALAYNDIASAVRLLDPTRNSDPSQLTDVGLSLYATRILMGHFSEAVALVESVQGTKELQPYLYDLSEQGRSAYEALRAFVKGGKGEAEFRERILAVRNKVVFHYDKAEVCEAIRRMAAEIPSDKRTMVVSDSPINTRFLFADTVMERVIGEILWKMDHQSNDTQKELYQLFDWCMRHVRMYLDFAGDLCGTVLLSLAESGPEPYVR